MEIAIVDDEVIILNKMSNIIEKVCFRNNISFNIKTFVNSSHIIQEYNKYDVIFLDIDMPAISGLKAADEINNRKGENEYPLIVFVTNKENMVFDALKKFPYMFLRKSHFKEEIERCILKMYYKINGKGMNTYGIKVGRETVFIDLDDTIFLEKEKNYVVFHVSDKSYRERTTIETKYNDLCKKGFIKVNSGCLVNRRYISEIGTHTIKLKNNTCISLSKSCKVNVRNEYFNWMVKSDD